MTEPEWMTETKEWLAHNGVSEDGHMVSNLLDIIEKQRIALAYIAGIEEEGYTKTEKVFWNLTFPSRDYSFENVAKAALSYKS